MGKHLDAEQGIQAYWAWACPLWLGWNEYPVKAGEVNRHIVWYTSLYPRSRSVRWMPDSRAGLQRSAQMYGNRQRIRGASRWCSIQKVYFTCNIISCIVCCRTSVVFTVWWNGWIQITTRWRKFNDLAEPKLLTDKLELSVCKCGRIFRSPKRSGCVARRYRGSYPRLT